MIPISIMLVEDHLIVREGLKMLLSTDDDITVVAEAGDAQEAYESAKKHRPQVILMDIALPGTDGIEASLKIKQELPAVHIVMLTMHVDEQLVTRAIHAGASGYLLKSVSREQLVSTIRAVRDGQVFLPAELTRTIIGMVDINIAEEELTVREKEILLFLKKGFTNKEIAQHLCISGSTVKTHLHNMFTKLGVNNRAAAIAKAIKSRLLYSKE